MQVNPATQVVGPVQPMPIAEVRLNLMAWLGRCTSASFVCSCYTGRGGRSRRRGCRCCGRGGGGSGGSRGRGGCSRWRRSRSTSVSVDDTATIGADVDAKVDLITAAPRVK